MMLRQRRQESNHQACRIELRFTYLMHRASWTRAFGGGRAESNRHNVFSAACVYSVRRAAFSRFLVVLPLHYAPILLPPDRQRGSHVPILWRASLYASIGSLPSGFHGWRVRQHSRRCGQGFAPCMVGFEVAFCRAGQNRFTNPRARYYALARLLLNHLCPGRHARCYQPSRPLRLLLALTAYHTAAPRKRRLYHSDRSQ